MDDSSFLLTSCFRSLNEIAVDDSAMIISALPDQGTFFQMRKIWHAWQRPQAQLSKIFAL